MSENPPIAFLWKIENFPYCPNIFDEYLKSPEFYVSSLNKSIWQLRIRCENNEVKVSLDNKSYCENSTLTIGYDIAFLSADGSVVHSGTVRNKEISVGSSYEISNYPSFTYIYETKRNEFLPKNTLTIRCQIYKKSMQNSIQFLAFTRIGIQKRSFHWAVTKFSKLKPNGKKKCRRINVGDEEETFLIELYLKERFANEESVGIDIRQLNMNISKLCSKWRISVLNGHSGVVKSKDDIIWFSSGDNAENFPSFFTKDELVSMRDVCLVNDTLDLLFDVTFSTGAVTSNIESVLSLPCWIQEASNSSIAERVLYESDDESVNVLQKELLSLYQDKTLSDFELRNGIASFPVHRSILSARSPVLKAMFSSGMQEGTAQFLDIQDISADILERMLTYIYTGKVGISDWKTACSLYYATEKYEILSLKKNCSSYLASNITDSNVCEILLLADRHNDESLKSSVHEFIVLNDCKIIASNEWKPFLVKNPLLAAETMQLVYSRKLDLNSSN